MRPTHLNIVGNSKFLFHRDVMPRLAEGRFSKIIKKIAQGATVVFTEDVTSSDDLDPLITYLVRTGIPRNHIRIRFPSESGQALLATELSKGIRESGLSFGADVAERDDGLGRYFITTQSFQRVQSHKTHIVVGPKGSGKSAILRELNAVKKDDGEHRTEASLVITPEHYATEVLNAITGNPISSELSAFTTTWKYTLLVEMFRRLVQQQIGESRALAEMRQYLIDHKHFGGDLTLFERFLGYLRRITQIKGKIGPAEAELGVEKATELEKLFKMEELLALMPALQRVLRRTSFTIYIDELDQSWNNTDTANRFLVSLLTAAIQLRGISQNLHVVVFLRSEVFDLLKPHLPQLDKLRTDIETLHWSGRELGNLIVSRALDSLGIDETVQAEAVIRQLFPGTIAEEDVGGFEYLLSRTSARPREVIQFCNLALNLAALLEQRAIVPEAILRAEEEFSGWKLEHIVAENMYIHPRLDDLLEHFRGRSRRLSFHALDSLLTELILKTDEQEPKPLWFKQGMEPVGLLKLLYNLEVLGIEKGDGTPEFPRQWDAYDFVFNRPKGKPETSPTFLFHPGLWKALELV